MLLDGWVINALCDPCLKSKEKNARVGKGAEMQR